jgi:hypothetical protein
MNTSPNYHREFWKSPQHVVLALVTLGAGFVSADWLPLIVGTTAYALGWVYLPDMAFFRGWVDRRHAREQQKLEAEKVAAFVQRRDQLLGSLASPRRDRYRQLAEVCRDIERASSDSPLAAANSENDPRLRKLDELMWTFLRLLGMEESLERFLEIERKEDIPRMLEVAEAEAQRLSQDIETLKNKGNTAALENKQRFLSSRLERLEVLRKRHQRAEQARDNLALVVSEQERLEQQIKLIRADAVAARNTDALTARIDATVEHLDQTNKWLSEMDEFKDLAGDLPPTDIRVGYHAVVPPPVIPEAQPRRQAAQKQRT